jgi:hypothetical protein
MTNGRPKIDIGMSAVALTTNMLLPPVPTDRAICSSCGMASGEQIHTALLRLDGSIWAYMFDDVRVLDLVRGGAGHGHGRRLVPGAAVPLRLADTGPGLNFGVLLERERLRPQPLQQRQND